MDRLSEGSRVAMQAFRQALSPDGVRVDRNWDAIERRALELDLDAPDDFEELAPDELDEADLAAIAAIERAAPTPRRRWRIAAAAIAIAAAAVAVVTLVPAARTATERPSTASDAAAYDAEPEAPEGRADAVAPAPDVVPTPPRPAIELPIPTPVVIVPTATPEPNTTPTKRARRVEPTPAATPAVTSDADALALREEATLLRRARSALKSGDASAALALVAEHARRFPDGRLAEEIAVLRIAALCEGGRHEAGRAAADAFLAAHPSSPLGARVRGLCPRP